MKPGNDLAVAGFPLPAGIATCEINCRTPVDRQHHITDSSQARENRCPRSLGEGVNRSFGLVL
jgi:hypothetical protein